MQYYKCLLKERALIFIHVSSNTLAIYKVFNTRKGNPTFLLNVGIKPLFILSGFIEKRIWRKNNRKQGKKHISGVHGTTLYDIQKNSEGYIYVNSDLIFQTNRQYPREDSTK